MGRLRFHIRLKKLGDPYVPDATDRLNALYKFWDFINDIRPEILDWSGPKRELTEQIICSALYHLYPHFSALDTSWEVINVFRAAKIPLPDSYHGIFCDTFSAWVKMRLAKTG